MAKTKEVGIRLSVKDKEIAERALKDFGTAGETALRKIQGAAAPASVSLHALNAAAGGVKQGMAGMIGGAASALVAFVSLGAVIAGTKAALDAFGATSDSAKASGLDVEFFQELAYGAELGGVGVDQLSSSLETFNKNSGLAVVNKGKMLASLKALNPELLKNIQAARSQEERVRLAADAIDKEATASGKAALATTMFGESGTRMVEVFRGGSAALAATAEQARELGIVIDGALIDRAEALGDEFDVATKVMDVQFKAALVSLAPILISTAQVAGAVADAIRQIIDAMQSLDNQSTARLEARMQALGAERVQVENDILKLQDDARQSSFLPFGFDNSADIANKKKRLGEIGTEESSIIGVLTPRMEKPTPPPPPPPPSSGSNSEAKAALREAEALTKRLRSASEDYAATVSKLDGQLSAGLITQTTYNRAVAEAIVKRVDAAKGETEYASALTLANAARAAGTISEEEYTKSVEAMTERRLKAENTWSSGVQLGLLKIVQQSRNIGDSVSDSLVSGVKSFEDALVGAITSGKFEWQDLAQTIISDLIRIQIRQNITGPISNILSGILGSVGGGGFGSPGNDIGSGAGAFSNIGKFLASAKGNVFDAPGLSAYSSTIVSKPTVFPFAKGIGLMAEAGAEAVMPLARNSIGQLGVHVSGSGQSAPVFNLNLINASGAPVETSSVEKTPNSSGGLDITATLKGGVKTMFADGSMDGIMASTYGLKRKGR